VKELPINGVVVEAESVTAGTGAASAGDAKRTARNQKQRAEMQMNAIFLLPDTFKLDGVIMRFPFDFSAFYRVNVAE